VVSECELFSAWQGDGCGGWFGGVCVAYIHGVALLCVGVPSCMGRGLWAEGHPCVGACQVGAPALVAYPWPGHVFIPAPLVKQKMSW